VKVPTYLMLASGMALFGSATPVSKIVGRAFPAMLGSGLRMATAALVLIPALLWLHRDHGAEQRLLPRLDRRDWLRLGGIAVIGTVGFTLALLYGLRIVPGAVGAVIMATAPAVTAAGAVVFLHDRLDKLTATGIALGVAGVVAVNVGVDPTDTNGVATALWLGSLLVFAAVCCEAAYTLLGKRLTADLTPVQIAAIVARRGNRGRR